MPAFICYRDVHETVERTIFTTNRSEAAENFCALTGHWPDVVGEDECLGGCENCSTPIFEGDDNAIITDVLGEDAGGLLCSACKPPPPPKVVAEARRQIPGLAYPIGGKP